MISNQIEPLKEDIYIRQLKAERCLDGNALNVETVLRRFKGNDEKHKKLEDTLSLIKDQLLEKNLIFKGIYESDYEDPQDVKVQLIKAIANTMPGEDSKERKTQAECTFIDQVERIG